MNVKNNNKKCEIIKEFFKKIKYDTLYSVCDDNILSNIKKDLILQVSVDKGLNNVKTNIGINYSINLIRVIDDDEFHLDKFNLEFKKIA